MGIGITGVQASGHTPTWIFPLADLTTPITDETTEIPLSVITGAVKADCYWDMGDFSISRTATTRSMRRACMKAAVERKTGETRTGSIATVWDQQAEMTETVNKVYALLSEGAEIGIFQALGWDEADEPAAGMVGDLMAATITMRNHPTPATDDEDIKASADFSIDAYAQNVKTTAGP